MLIDMNTTSSAIVTQVQAYIDVNIFNSSAWDRLEDRQKLKAINNSYTILTTMLPDIFPVDENNQTIDIYDLVTEIMWIVKKDDSTDRADQGALMLTLGDMTMQFDSSMSNMIIAPELINKYGLTSAGQKRRVGRYELPIEDTARTGFYKGDKERFGYEK